MVRNSNASSKIKKFFSGKGFYIALAFCLIAVGTAAYTAVQLNPSDEQSEPFIVDQGQEPDVQWGEQQANTPATDVPDTRENTTRAATTASASTQAQKTYELPLSTDIVKDYSNGEMVLSKTMGDWRVHNGIDFKGATGSEVKAICAGTVRSITTDELFGVIVEIDHGDGVIAKYCGLDKNPPVSKGAAVKSGQKIGLVGTVPCESADAQHLHFEIWVNGKITDPLEILGKADS